MDGIGLALLGTTLVAGLGALRWQRHRRQRLPVTSQSVRCPLHDCQADVTVRTDAGARSDRRYVEIAGCSLLADAAIGLPERTAYLPDAPPCKVLLESASPHPVYTTEVACRQSCVFVLNAAAPSVAPKPLECASGTSDGIDLMRQVARDETGSRLLWYSSF
jgi:hypothetical protein